MIKIYKILTKRIIDIIASLLLVIISVPVIFIVALLVRLQIGSPVFFKQNRPGYKKKPFTIYKFRTMSDEKDSNGNLLPDENRLNPFGKFLRSSSLDELPELLNVLKGDMSLVGPRPLLMEYLKLYTPKQARRHEVKPGLTGWAQINGRNDISWEEKFEYDVWYVENMSFMLDMKILFLTIGKVFLREDINQSGQATVEYFKGN